MALCLINIVGAFGSVFVLNPSCVCIFHSKELGVIKRETFSNEMIFSVQYSMGSFCFDRQNHLNIFEDLFFFRSKKKKFK